MCGLTGVLLSPTHRSPETWRDIVDIATSNLIFNEERGREASGIATIQANGSHHIFKQPVEASSLVQMPDYQRIMSSLGDQTVGILGHTRMPTKGSRWHNVNNHPIQAGHVIGIHNGVITNDDRLFSQRRLSRTGEVDSEIIFRLLDTVDPLRLNGRYVRHTKEQIHLLRGTFATLSIDLREPHRLLVLKHLRPLCIHYEEKWQALFFSSRYIFLRKAFGRSVITEALDSGYGFYFDARDLPQRGNQPVHTFEIITNDSPDCITR